MNRFRSFPWGGVRPVGSKALTRHLRIQNSVIPPVFTVPLQQHAGGPAECVVKPGDRVREGMLIGRRKGYISASVHAPVPGVVREISQLLLPSGVRTSAVVIDVEGEFDRLGKKQLPVDRSGASAQELLDVLAELGVVGLGGVGLPTHVKFSLPKASRVDLLIINGVESEPYLTGDHRLMLEKAKEILQGISIIQRILSPRRIVMVTEADKTDVIAAIAGEVRTEAPDVEIVPLEVRYPQGDEKQVIKALTGVEVPSGGVPMDLGIMISNVGTVFSIYEAVNLGKPLIERTLTVSGGAVRKPGNFKVRIGTPVGELLAECGGFVETPEKIVVGGPMMGAALQDLNTPVTKLTTGVLALTSREVRSAPRTACIDCGECVSVCPLGLDPTRLFKLVDHSEHEKAVAEGLLDCQECGCCGYVCPSRIPLVDGLRLGKRTYLKGRAGQRV